MDLPQRPPHTPPPASAVHRLLPKMRKRLAAIHPSPPAHIAARDERRRSPAERTSALRSLFAPRACRCSFSQSKRYAAATTACLLPRAISWPMLTALFFCLELPQIVSAIFDTSASYHALRERPGRLADVMCSTSSLLCDQCLLIFLEKTHSHRIAVPLAHQCDGDF